MVNAALKEFFRDPREYLFVKQISPLRVPQGRFGRNDNGSFAKV
jgi:hypothetical protein